MVVPLRTISVRMIFRSPGVDDGNGSRVNFPPGVRPCCIFSSRWRTGRPVGLISFYSVMERLKMLDSLQATQLQSAIVKAMYAATIESDLDTEKAFEYIAGAPQGQKDNPLINILDKFSTV